MFSGIVREVGEVVVKQESAEGATLQIRCSRLLKDLEMGDSVSIDGVCLTVSKKNSAGFEVQASPETLRRTNLVDRACGDQVNLEPAACLKDFLGGHLVQGHVDGTGEVISVRREGNSCIVRFAAPSGVLTYCILKGSIAVNGVSLTISDLDKHFFEVTIIPHTLKVTNFSDVWVGQQVNLESDMISKYVKSHVQRLLGILVILTFFASDLALGGTFSLRSGSILLYENMAGTKKTPFVIRVARFRPDTVLEWESVSNHGTLHLFQNAVQKGQRWTLTRLFETGADIESKEVMTIWLSKKMFQELMGKRATKVKFGRLPLKLAVHGEGPYTVRIDGKAKKIPVIYLRDDRQGEWSVQKDADNPILVEYTSRYFQHSLKVVHTSDKGQLRWIRKLPPVR